MANFFMGILVSTLVWIAVGGIEREDAKDVHRNRLVVANLFADNIPSCLIKGECGIIVREDGVYIKHLKDGNVVEIDGTLLSEEGNQLRSFGGTYIYWDKSLTSRPLL